MTFKHCCDVGFYLYKHLYAVDMTMAGSIVLSSYEIKQNTAFSSRSTSESIDSINDCPVVLASYCRGGIV